MELEQLQSLRDRVAQATGPDREIDAEIWRRTKTHEMYDCKFTASIDAALAWVERVGCYMISLEWDRLGVMAHVGHRDEALNSWKGNASTPALAIILAGLDALIAKEKTDV